MQIITSLQEVIAKYNLLAHPFYQAWSNGELTAQNLKNYAIQYYQQVASFPRFVSRVHTHCPEITARKVLLSNLVDEEIHGTDHPTLWMQFAEGMGATRAEVVNAKALPETTALVDEFYALADEDWRTGLCALYAYEAQVPAVAASKIDGLKRFYGINDQKTLEFFAAHQQYDVEHAQQVAGLIEQYVGVEQAKDATARASAALWKFLDGMCHSEGISCTA